MLQTNNFGPQSPSPMGRADPHDTDPQPVISLHEHPILRHGADEQVSQNDQFEFRRPITRSFLSPFPQDINILQASPMNVPRMPRWNHEHFEATEMHLEATPFKKNSNSKRGQLVEELLDFSQYEDEEERYQTPNRQAKAAESYGQATAHTVKLQPYVAQPIETIEEEKPERYGSSKPPNTKGLRALAQDVSHIVEYKKFTTYKEVAEMQIQKMEMEGKISKNVKYGVTQSKDSQNIKRRVYDALNVLISAGVLVRDGKVVSIDPSVSKNAGKNAKIDERQRLRQQIDISQANLSEKKAKLMNLTNRYLAHHYLVSRNKEAQEKQEDSKRVPMPCIVLPLRKGQYKCRLLRKTLRVSTKNSNGIHLYGDLDAIVALDFHEESELAEELPWLRSFEEQL